MCTCSTSDETSDESWSVSSESSEVASVLMLASKQESVVTVAPLLSLASVLSLSLSLSLSLDSLIELSDSSDCKYERVYIRMYMTGRKEIVKYEE